MPFEDNVWLFGVVFSLCAAVFNNLGVNLSKLTHVKMNEMEVRRLTDMAVLSPVHKKKRRLRRLADPGGEQEEEEEEEEEEHQQEQEQEEEKQPDEGPTLEAAASEPLGEGTSSSPTLQSPLGSPHAADGAPAMPPAPLTHSLSGSLAKENAKVSEEFKPRPWVDKLATRFVLASSEDTARPYYMQPLWHLAFLCQVVGALCDFASLAFAAQSLVAPLGALTLVVNIYLAPIFSQETLSRRDVYSTVVIVCGAAVSVAFASHEDEERSPEEQFEFFVHPRFLAYGTFIATAVLFLGSIIRFIDRIRAKMAYARMPQVIEAREELKAVLRFLYGAMAGICGAQSILFAKSASVMARFGFFGMWGHYQTFLVVGGLFFTLFLQIKFLNEALERFDALIIVPIFEAFWVTGAVVGGLIVYEESENYGTLQAAMFGVGVVIVIVGVYSISIKRSSSRNERQNSRLLLHRQSLANAGAAAAAAAATEADAGDKKSPKAEDATEDGLASPRTSGPGDVEMTALAAADPSSNPSSAVGSPRGAADASAAKEL